MLADRSPCRRSLPAAVSERIRPRASKIDSTNRMTSGIKRTIANRYRTRSNQEYRISETSKRASFGAAAGGPALGKFELESAGQRIDQVFMRVLGILGVIHPLVAVPGAGVALKGTDQAPAARMDREVDGPIGRLE